jgi:hypothetical protein
VDDDTGRRATGEGSGLSSSRFLEAGEQGHRETCVLTYKTARRTIRSESASVDHAVASELVTGSVIGRTSTCSGRLLHKKHELDTVIRYEVLPRREAAESGSVLDVWGCAHQWTGKNRVR